jgi:hypothetical protein
MNETVKGNDMNTNTKYDAASSACLNMCRRIKSQIAKSKDAVLAQFRGLVAEHERLLLLALGEAEALAWQTRFPQLVFPDLAEEKARNIVHWVATQRHLGSGTQVSAVMS